LDRLVLWRGTDEWLAEAAAIDLGERGMNATGIQLGADPVPYRLGYRLDAGDGFVTRALTAEASGDGWTRRMELVHDGKGGWRHEVDAGGEAPFGDPDSVDAAALEDALDCDLEFSPLTNLMPVRRHSLHERELALDFLMAWVSVPELGLHASPQRYEHVRREDQGSVVRFVSLDGDFRSELRYDEEGVVVEYPQLARRIAARERP
jgi:uncharacterized protein